MASLDNLNAVLALIFAIGHARGRRWHVWLGTLTLTLSIYATALFNLAKYANGAWVGSNLAGYLFINFTFLPVVCLFVVTVFGWHAACRVTGDPGSQEQESKLYMSRKSSYLRAYLYIFGLFNIFIIPTVPVIFGDLFLWLPRNLANEIMMSSLYFAMGVIMLAAGRHPTQHKAFVDYVILGNVLHALVMAIMAQNPIHLLLDVIPIGGMGLLPLLFYPWGFRNFLIGSALGPEPH